MSSLVDPGAVHALADAVERADGVAAFSEQTLLNLDSPGPRELIHLPVEDGGGLMAYAQVDGGSAELAVHPDHRRRGIGRALLDRVLQARPDAAVWAHGPHPGATALASYGGLRVVRELWLMTAPAPSGPPVPEPREGVVLTTFDAARDGDDWVRVNARAFAHHPEQGRMTRADLDARVAEPWFDPDGFWLARDSASGALLGSMWTKVTGEVGEIYVLGIDPDAQGRGLGALLTAVAMHRFAEQHLRAVELYVEADNAAAIRTYQRAGFVRRRADVQYARG